MEDIKEVSPSDTMTEEKSEVTDPLKTELENVQKKGARRSQREKLIYTKNRVEKQLRDLETEDGVEPQPESDDEKPLTRAEYNELERQKAIKTAIDLADSIESETERELTRYHLENTIKPSGNPNLDFKNARAIVNSAKNAIIVEEVSRKGNPKTHTSSGGAVPQVEPEAELTADEQVFMQQFGLTKQQVLDARSNKNYKFSNQINKG